jgi:hypothetical protein
MRFLWGLDPLKFFAGALTIAWGIGFARYIGNGAWSFPIWPNLLDVVGLCLVGLYLVRDSFGKGANGPEAKRGDR